MSDLLIKVCKIDDIKVHPNAEKLQIAIIGGWEVIIGKDNHKIGDVIVHVPPDSMVPFELAQKWGVDKYLSFGKHKPTFGRVKATKLRGIVSYGFIVSNDANAQLGDNLIDLFKIYKYEPPEPQGGFPKGQLAKQHPLFHQYTDIQNLRNYPDKLDYSKELVILGKVHGSNSRVGFVCTEGAYELVLGSHRRQLDPNDGGVFQTPLNLYGEKFQNLFEVAKATYGDLKSFIVIGEVYGRGVQDLHYGINGKDFRAFDIAINGEYLPWKNLQDMCVAHNIPTVVELARGHFTFEEIVKYASGPSELGGHHMREGIVVRPLNEELIWKKGELDPNPKRMIFKVINPDYLTRKGGTEFH